MANFNFKSPSVKFQEIDRSFASTASLGITSVGMAGESLKGPAFASILVTSKAEFRRYFGGTSAEKFIDGSGKMKFLAPTYANTFLEEGSQLYFTRILGKSGYNAGLGWAIRVGAPVSSTALTTTEISGSVSVSTSTFLGINITGNGDYNNLPLIYNKTNSVATAQTVYLKISGFSASSSTVSAATSAATGSVTGITSYTGQTLYGISLVSATATTGTSLNNLPLIWAYDSTTSTYTGLTAFLVVSGYVSSSLTSSIRYTATTFSASEKVTPASGVASYSAFTFTAKTDPVYENMVVAILRSRGQGSQENATFNISSVTATFNNAIPLSNITITAYGATVSETLTFNLDSTSSNFITKAMGRKNSDTKANVWCEAIYPDLIKKLTTDGKINEIKDIIQLGGTSSASFSDYNLGVGYTTPETPWIVSELYGSKISRLFKFISYSDGDSANKEIKVAVENINFNTLEFDIIIRDYNDTDTNPSILERFGRCVMDPESNNFIMRRIGGVYSNAEDSFLEDAKSAYVYVNVHVDAPVDSIPAGFEGYHLPLFSVSTTDSVSAATPVMLYKTGYTATDKVLKTYLGISEKAFDAPGTKGLSINDDMFKFYGPNTTFGGQSSYKTKGFHFDVNATGKYTASSYLIGEFSVGAGQFNNTGVYSDITTRKFVVVPYGGFDGWDVNYEVVGGRSITSIFNPGGGNSYFEGCDYDAYLEAYRVYEDTERTPINLFATPGINWSDNLGLVEDTISIIEEIRQDALYIIDAPDAGANDTSTVAANSYAVDLESTDIDSSYAATYVPYIRRKDPDSNTNIYIPPTGEVLRAMALADRTSFIWFATAGLNRGGLPNARDVRKTFKESDRDTLYLARLNPIVKFSNNTPGVFIYGQKTLQIADSKLDRIDVRRLLLYAKQIISSQARLYLFEPNDDVLATNFIAESNKKLKVIQDNRGLQTFRVRLDNTLNTPESRDRNEIYFVIDLLPIGAVEFIGLTFVVNKSTSAIQFDA